MQTTIKQQMQAVKRAMFMYEDHEQWKALNDAYSTLASIALNESVQKEQFKEVLDALCGIIWIGKRNTENPKYDSYYEEAKKIMKKHGMR